MSTPEPIDTDEIFELLANERRRMLLTCLQDHDPPLALADVAQELAVREYDVPLDEIPAEAVENLYMALYHSHIPKLNAYGVVAHDQEEDIVALTERVTLLQPYLELADAEAMPHVEARND